jgi:exosortase/archaeosortase family protein
MWKKIIFLTIKVFALYCLWYLIINTQLVGFFYKIILGEVFFLSKYSLLLLGKFFYFSVYGIKLPDNCAYLIFYKEGVRSTLVIAYPCLGLEVMYMFSAIIIVFFGPWKKKLWYIPLGILIFNTLNILRIIALVFIYWYFPKYLEFNHHFVFRFILYLSTLILVIIWIVKYANEDIINIFKGKKSKISSKNNLNIPQ